MRLRSEVSQAMSMTLSEKSRKRNLAPLPGCKRRGQARSAGQSDSSSSGSTLLHCGALDKAKWVRLSALVVQPVIIYLQQVSPASSLARVARFQHTSIRPRAAMIADSDCLRRGRPVAPSVRRSSGPVSLSGAHFFITACSTRARRARNSSTCCKSLVISLSLSWLGL
jgi:hypothetical protein